MNDPDNFLSRWSRRKQEAGEGKEKNETGEAVAAPAPENQPGKSAEPRAAPIPKFDVESLPPVDTISAETEITAFMRTGVPETLKHAALRRAWSADPVIRDFVGLNENFWDAGGPDGIPGFGDLDPNLDVRRMVSELFGETPHQDTPPESETERVADSPALPIQNRAEAIEAAQVSPTSPENVPQHDENAAVQTESPEAAPEKKFARRHGGAMPQ
ncbi:MAG TPA: DUF3306 domain-containing protein [Pseudolabrys sp.]|nr:DUF3306 domain-containing protein [Pseudolabrys sp.]